MNLNNYRDEVGDFLRKVDPESSSTNTEMVKMLDNEFEQLKEQLDNPNRFHHQIYDMLFLLFELAAKNDFDLDAEWRRGREKKRNYLRPNEF